MRPDDAAVVAGYLDGDPEAVATVDSWIARAAWPYQRRLAHRWDDVLQDVRVEVTRLLQRREFRGGSSLKTYLWRVVNHTCLDQIRGQSRWQWADLEAVDHAAGALVERGPSLQGQEEARDLLLRVWARMSADCRELWRMIAGGLSYREMSGRKGVAEGTLRVRVMRCREKAAALREELNARGVAGSGKYHRNAGDGAAPNTDGEAIPDDL
ncbi:MAG TPA: RNA polymerase sigma factor [Thermoanaerobaculia bacterium]|nr:RNA polymerase sigma factor [Thermoanaerobaculia bacterium]